MKIYGYLFNIVVEEGESGYITYAPGVGGIYEEGETKDEAISNAYDAACVVFETRIELNNPIVEDNPHLKVLRKIPGRQSISRIKGIPDGYIAIPRCLVPAGA